MGASHGHDESFLERALGLESLDGETPEEAAARARVEHRLASLAELLEPVAPGADLFARIAADTGLESPPASSHTVRNAEGEWRAIADGVAVKTLWTRPRDRRRAMLLRVEPGATLPGHRHDGDEECLILEGDLEINGTLLGKGDFHVAFAATTHPAMRSPSGCMAFISVGR